MDVQMPKMSGIEVTAAIRAREVETGRHLPIIAMTAHALAGDGERCLAAGMDAYVAKPIEAEDLERALAGPWSDGPGTAPNPDPSFHTYQHSALDRADLLDRADGDATLLRDMVRLFLEALPAHLAALGNAVSRRDGLALWQTAHAMKGMVGNFGKSPAHASASRLERMGKSGDLSEIEADWSRLQDDVAQLRAELLALDLEECAPGRSL